MVNKVNIYGNTNSYKASITREQFLFYEMRTTAKLMDSGLTDNEVVEKIVDDNLFQYPTERSVRRMAKTCIKRLKSMNDDTLITAIANIATSAAKQICLYAMMKESRLVREFMIMVIGEKYKLGDNSFGKIDLNTFFSHLQEQEDAVASWSDTTITKIKQVLTRILVENEYLDSIGADILNPVWLNSTLENAIKSNGDSLMLPAFNCFI